MAALFRAKMRKQTNVPADRTETIYAIYSESYDFFSSFVLLLFPSLPRSLTDEYSMITKRNKMLALLCQCHVSVFSEPCQLKTSSRDYTHYGFIMFIQTNYVSDRMVYTWMRATLKI